MPQNVVCSDEFTKFSTRPLKTSFGYFLPTPRSSFSIIPQVKLENQSACCAISRIPEVPLLLLRFYYLFMRDGGRSRLLGCWDHDLSQKHTLNQLSRPGAPEVPLLTFMQAVSLA